MTFLTSARRTGPWFRRRPRVSIAVAVVLFAAILALRLTTGGATDATTMFFVLPISLLAVTFGLAGGLAGGLVSVGLVLAWVIADDVPLSPIGWATRALPMLLLGALLGHAADLLRRSEAQRAQLDEAAHWHRQAVEINDSIVQGLAAAKWSLEAGRLDRGLTVVTDTLEQAEAMVSQLLRDAEMGPGGAHAPGGHEPASQTPGMRAPGRIGPGADRLAALFEHRV